MGIAQSVDIGEYNVQIGRKIGEGGFAYIYAAEDAIGRKFALKRVIVPQDDVDRNREARREQDILRSLPPHPNIVTMYASTSSMVDGHVQYHTLLEYCVRSVFDMMLDASRNLTPLPEAHVMRIWRDAAFAIHHLHSQDPPIAHRDLKVENLLLGTDQSIKLCDFGSCTTAVVQCVNRQDIIAAEDDISKHSTLAYRAPEQVDLYLRKTINIKVDVWALGVLLYKLTIGKTPFEDALGNVEKMGILNAKIRFPDPFKYSPAIRELIEFLLQADPDTRPTVYDALKWAAVAASQGLLPHWPATQLPPSPRGISPSASSPHHSPSPSIANGNGSNVAASNNEVDTGNPFVSDAMMSTFSWHTTTPEPQSQRANERHSFSANTPPPVHHTPFQSVRVDADAHNRRHSALFERAKNLFGAFGGESGEFSKWVAKATSTQRGFPKAKYMRKIVMAIWEKQLTPQELLPLLLDRPWATDASVCIKMLVLILKVLQQGPPAMLGAYTAYLGFLEEVSHTWGNINSGAEFRAATYVTKLCSVLIQKLNFHAAHPEFGHHFTTLAMMVGSDTLPKDLSKAHIANVLSRMLPIQQTLISVYREASAVAVSPMLSPATVDTVTASMLPVIEESYVLFVACTDLLIGLLADNRRNNTSNALLEVMQEQYSQQLVDLRTFYKWAENIPFIRTMDVLTQTQLPSNDPVLEMLADEQATGERQQRPNQFGFTLSKEDAFAAFNRLEVVQKGGADDYAVLPNAYPSTSPATPVFQQSPPRRQSPPPPQQPINAPAPVPISTDAAQFDPFNLNSPAFPEVPTHPIEIPAPQESTNLLAFEDPFTTFNNASVSMALVPFSNTSPAEIKSPHTTPASVASSFAPVAAPTQLATEHGFSSDPFEVPVTRPQHSPTPSSYHTPSVNSNPFETAAASFDPFSLGDMAENTFPSVRQSTPPVPARSSTSGSIQSFAGSGTSFRDAKSPASAHAVDPFSSQASFVPSNTQISISSAVGSNTFSATSETQIHLSDDQAAYLATNSAASTPQAFQTSQDWNQLDDLVTIINNKSKSGRSHDGMLDFFTPSIDIYDNKNPFNALFSDNNNPFGDCADVIQPTPVEAAAPAPPPVAAAASTEEIDAVYTPAAQPWRANLRPALRQSFEECARAFRAWGCEVDFAAMQVEKVIGTGAFAVVYRAKCRGKNVAVKKLLSTAGAPINPKTIFDFKCEAEFMKSLRHPNIVEMIGTCTNPLATIMEFCERGALFSVLADKSTTLTWPMRQSMMLGLAQGMHYLHTRTPVIIHRDLKSLNVLLTEDWTTKVTDFGLSRYSPKSVSEQMTGQIGTYHWMAPEVINGNHYTEKADVYSYGIILWEILTRRTPYEGLQPVQVVAAVINRNQRPNMPPDTDPALRSLIEDCWQTVPGLRPSFTDVIERITSLELV